MVHVTVLGGGFAGLEAAIYLRKEGFRVTLVSDRDYFYIYPTSIWIPTSQSSFNDVCIDLEELSEIHGFELIIDGVEKIDAKHNTIILNSGSELKKYDYLVIALGAGKMKHKGLENTLSICGKPEVSLQIQETLDKLIAQGSGELCFGFGANPYDTSAVRGGPGFELMFNVHHMLKKKGVRDKFKLTFFAPMAEPGKRMGPKALKMMDMFFERLDIQKHFGKKIKEFQQESVVFEDDSTLKSDFTMFIPASDGHAVVKSSDLPTTEAGFIKTDEYSKVLFEESNMPKNIYAIGDVVSLMGPEWRAKQGHIAEVMARNVAHNIKQEVQGYGEFKSYIEHINILCVMDSGDGAAFVYRDDKRAFMLPLPFLGHWLKKAWGHYCRLSKLDKIPRIPGM